MHASGSDQIIGDTFCSVDGNGEANTGSGAARRVNRGIDADDVAVRIDERAAGVALIDGRVRLDRFFDEGGLAGLHCAS